MVHSITNAYVIIELLPDGSRMYNDYHVAFELENRPGLYLKLYAHSGLESFQYVRVKFSFDIIQKLPVD